MKTFIVILLLNSIVLCLQAQDDKVIHWINKNAIEIENANPDSQLVAFHKQLPKKFSEAQIFGFGEATHHSKEFFDIKAKFFKYLVEHQEVKAFLMEESYPAEAGINEWISGGEGDIKTLAQHFSIDPWKCQEVLNLLQWIRNFNIGRPTEAQVRFYGIDIQTVEGINTDIRLFAEKNTIQINEALLLVADSCADSKFMYQRPAPNWASTQIPKLKEIERILLGAKSVLDTNQIHKFNALLRALNSLVNYTEYVQNPQSTVRDKAMFENTKHVIEQEAKNGRAFIWAHNLHINNKGLPPYGSNWMNLGSHLKTHYKEKYYSVGFDFGSGTLPTYIFKKQRWESSYIKKPFRNTYAKTLNQANYEHYFIDMEEVKQSEAAFFFRMQKKQFMTGGSGYTSKTRSLVGKTNYSETYDGLIFVKTVSIANYYLKN